MVLIFVLLVVLGYWVYKNNFEKSTPLTEITETQVPLSDFQDSEKQISEPVLKKENEDIPLVGVIAEGLDTPWGITFLPGGGILVTERKGTMRLVDSTGNLKSDPVAAISSVREIGEGGLQGIAVHPNFKSNNYMYIYYTYSGGDQGTLNRVLRFIYEGEKFTDEKIIVDAIPGASNHDGGRIRFGPDGYLYVTTGDAQNPSSAQSKDSLSGKILRVKDDGTSAPGNPFASAQGEPSGNLVFSYGHRNPQGIAWDKNGTLWATEHGPSGIETGNDEFNKIEMGNNYGWPDIRGTQSKEGMVTPIIESGRGNTWAPAGLAYVNDRFFFAGLRGTALYELDANGKNLKTHFKGEYGRLREVIAGPDGLLYVTTSNRDGRGVPKSGDDKILRINPEKL